jgi:GTP-binding protein Era
MPQSPWLYPEDQMTDVPLRELASEITREQLFFKLQQELPYALMVETENWEEQKDGSVKIRQCIMVMRDSQKKIVLGKNGEMLKTIGSNARREISRVIGQKTHLFLFVKVQPDWIRV